MMNRKIPLWIKAPLLVLLVLSLCSCATYNQRISGYYKNLASANYEAANKQLESIKLLKKDRNYLLYLLEKGKILHLLHQYDSSNNVFNQADITMENIRTSVKDVALTYLLNPMMSAYKGEDFERFMIHYYKAMNYLQLGNTEDALVEARRISLAEYNQQDKFNNEQKYTQDAFALILQGMIYEKGNDMNNAFIAYRNAAEIFLKNNNQYYGVTLPLQLKKDLLRTAHSLGYLEEQNRFEKFFNMQYVEEQTPEGGELIFFWENGLAPVKEQQTLGFTLVKGVGGVFHFTDGLGQYNIPFDYNTPGYNPSINLSDVQMFTIALPKYVEQPLKYSQANIAAGTNSFMLEKAEDVNVLAIQTLQQRFVKELGSALSRMAIKKLTEMAVEKSKEKDPSKMTEEEKKQEEKKKQVREMAAFGLKIFNRLSEKTDTRNWQSLPASIYYTRIPLQKGSNILTLQISNAYGQMKKKDINITGKGDLQFINYCTLE